MKVVWKKSDRGESAYVGKVKIGSIFWNSIDPKNGQYKIGTLLPQVTLPQSKIDDYEEGKKIVEGSYIIFMHMLGVDVENDFIIVESEGVNMFFGTRDQFQDAFFSNASDEVILDWCKEHKYELVIGKKLN